MISTIIIITITIPITHNHDGDDRLCRWNTEVMVPVRKQTNKQTSLHVKLNTHN